jgi:tRNA pseudouridine55 synthase
MHYVINLNKRKWISSQDAVTEVKRLFGVKKAGHAGTLDPIATGVLIVCLNEATKITRFLSDLPKEYVATMRLGQRTDTLDAEGTIIEEKDPSGINETDIKAALSRFRGAIRQTPPMYSAIKRGGKPLYKLARKGIDVEREPRIVEIYELTPLGFEKPFVKLKVSCSKGTYIRTLCDDIGTALGVGAHMTELQRTRIGHFGIEDAALVGELPDKEAALNSIDSSLKHLDEVALSEGDYPRVLNGAAVSLQPYLPIRGEYIRIKNPEGKLFAVGVASGASLRVERMLHLTS